MAITQALTAPPVAVLSRASGDQFDTDVTAWLTWHNTQQTEYTTFTTQANALETAVNVDAATATTQAGISTAQAVIATSEAVDAAASAAAAQSAVVTTTTSVTSLTVGTGSKSLTVDTGKDIELGMFMVITDTAAPANWMHGTVYSYVTGTGALIMEITKTQGSGTKSAWTVNSTGPSGVDFTAANGSVIYLALHHGAFL